VRIPGNLGRGPAIPRWEVASGGVSLSRLAFFFFFSFFFSSFSSTLLTRQRGGTGSGCEL